MLNIKKQNIIDEDNNITSVIINYNDYLKLEEIIENYCLSRLIDEVNQDDYLDKDEAIKYYQNLIGVEIGS